MQINAGRNTLNVTMTLITGTLSGVVTDGSGNALSGVSVSIQGTTATTVSDGSYSINNIPPGSYTITFTKSGYTTVTK
jgi:hypothetical protein